MRLGRSLSTLLWAPMNALQALATVLWSALWISVALAVAAVAGPRPALTLARRVWAPGILAIGCSRLSVTGLDTLDLSRPYLVVANHQSWIDIPALFRALPVPLHFLAKRELASVPWLGWYIRAMGMVWVDRADLRRARGTVGRAADLLASGRWLVSFPEGTRSKAGRLGRFKSGGFGAALEASADVLPVALVGSGAVLPRDGFRVRPGPIEVRIGRPIASARFAPCDRAGLSSAAEHAIRALSASPGEAAAADSQAVPSAGAGSD